MKNFKYAFNEISRRPFLFIIIIIQIAVATIILSSGLDTSLKVMKKTEQAKEVLREDIYNIVVNNPEDTLKNIEENKEKIVDLYEYISEEYKGYDVIQANMFIKDFSEKDSFAYSLDEKTVFNPGASARGEFNNIKVVQISKEYINNFNLKVESGRSFSSDDFNDKDIIPVILGANYKGIYKVGDVFDFYDYEVDEMRKIEVIGILNEDSYYYNQTDIEILDDQIIYAKSDINLSSSNENIYKGITFIHLITDNKDEALVNIQNKCKELGLFTISLQGSDECMEIVISELNKEVFSSLSISACILLFIIISITTIQMNLVEVRINEFVVHLLSGATKRDIVIRCIYSNCIYLITGIVFGAIIKYNISNKSVINYLGEVNIILGGVFLVLLFLTSILPCLKIKNIEINQAIRGLNI